MADPAFQRVPCQICQRQDSSHFCRCTSPPTLFCRHCCDRHNSQNPHSVHQAIHIAVLSQDPEEYKRKHEVLTKNAADLRSNIVRMEQCFTEYAEMTQNCIDYLTKNRSQWLQKLQTEKEELASAIEKAIEEVRKSLDEGVEPVSALGQAISTSPPEMLRFRYEVTAPDLSTLCANWAHYQNHLKSFLESTTERQVEGTESQVQELVDVSASTLRFFNFATYAWMPKINLSTRIPIHVFSRWVIMEEGSVFCCGGNSNSIDWHEAYVIARDGFVERKDNMKVGRGLHGLLALSNAVYVFGGYQVEPHFLKECEMFQLHTQKWIELPEMYVHKWAFNPCLFPSIIYLCGSSQFMEAFSPETNAFLHVQIRVTYNWACCLYVDNDILVMHMKNYIVKFGVDQSGQLKIRSEVELPALADKAQSTQPVADLAKGFFFMNMCGECVCFDMNTGIKIATYK